MNRREIGKQAEHQARHFFEKKGLKLLEHNYTCYSGEIDLIMLEQEDIVFIEVRYKSRSDYGSPAESVNQSKQRKIIRAATHFLQKKKWLYKVSSRFDVMAVELVNDKWQMEWIKNAFMVEN